MKGFVVLKGKVRQKYDPRGNYEYVAKVEHPELEGRHAILCSAYDEKTAKNKLKDEVVRLLKLGDHVDHSSAIVFLLKPTGVLILRPDVGGGWIYDFVAEDRSTTHLFDAANRDQAMMVVMEHLKQFGYEVIKRYYMKVF